MALPFRSALPSEAIATPTDKSVCYSGPASPGQTTSRRKAFDYARLQDPVLIDMTPAGNWLDRQDLYANNTVTQNQAIWGDAEFIPRRIMFRIFVGLGVTHAGHAKNCCR
jgi:hypothetical protein